MPEYMEVVIFRLVLLSLLVLGVSLLTNIHVNERCMAPAKGADPNVLNRAMIAPINPRGTERDPDGFLGETGARVMDVQNTGNLLGMLLQSTRDDSYRVLTWTFRQGCALDWFPSGPAEEGEKPNLYPASYFQRFRSRMAFWFCFANLFGGGKEVLAQIDCTNNMNQADWNMYTVPADFEFSRGWFDRFSGNVSILEQPTVWMARVRADFERRLARDGRDLPAVIWMGDKEGSPVWKGIGYKSKSESLNQFWKNTGIGVFVTLGELEKKGPSGEDRLTDLCLSVIMFLRSEAWVGKYYDLKKHDVPHNVKLWRHTYQVWKREGMVKCGPARMYEHDQIWADPKSIDGAQWSRMETGCPRKWAAWKKDDPLLVDQNSAWCPTLSTGSINYAVRCDYPYFAEHPEGDFPKSLAFLAPYRSRSARGDKVNKPKQAPSVQDRINIEGDWKDGLRDAKRQRVDSEREEGEFKRHRRGPLDRRKGVYGKKKKGEVKANWRKYANELVNNLDAHGIRYIFAEKHWEQSFKNMGLP